MGRRKSSIDVLSDILRASSEAARRRERLNQQFLRDQSLARAKEERARQKLKKESERAAKESAKFAKQQYLVDRAQLVQVLSMRLAEEIRELESILPSVLLSDQSIDFDALFPNEEFRDPPNVKDYKVQRLTRLESLVPGKLEDHKKRLKEAKEKYYGDLQKFENEKLHHDRRIGEETIEINTFRGGYKSGESEAVVRYISHVLEKTTYPRGVPVAYRLAYDATSHHLAIEHQLPDISIIPSVEEYTYVKTKDEIREKPRTKANIRVLYQDIVASILLRILYSIFQSDREKHIILVTLTGYVETIDPATGLDMPKKVVSVQTTREVFEKLNLSRVEKVACLKTLSARISPKLEEAIAVKPIVEFDMVDSRFVEQSDVLSDLESSPNLMDLDWIEFENLVSNLFGQLGFEAKLTRSSRDRGVDAIAFDTRPIIGGKFVIQAKRYKNVVGVDAVRDLYGTLINEGASKGILITTSHFGSDAYEFAKDKPIELIDGNGLLYLLESVGFPARIIMPTE